MPHPLHIHPFCVAALVGDLLIEGACPCVQKSFSFPPRYDGHPTARAADVMPKTASHWFGDVMNISAAGFNLDLQVQWFKVRVLMLRVINDSPVFYFITLVIS